MSVGGRILRGTVWISIASVLARMGTFVGNLTVIRMLGVQQVGQLGLIESWLTLATIFSLFGLGIATTKYVAQYLAGDARRAGSVAGAAIVVTTLSSLAVGMVFYVILTARPAGSVSGMLGTAYDLLAAHAVIFVALIVTTTWKNLAHGLVYGVQAFQVLVWVNLAIGLVSVPVLYLMTRALGLTGTLNAKLLLTLVEVALLIWPTWRVLRRLGAQVSVSHVRRDGKQLLAFGLPTFIGQLAASPAQTLMQSFLAAQPGGFVQVGYLTVANRLVSLASFVPGSMASTLIPVLSAEWGRGVATHFRDSAALALRMMWLSTLPVVVVFAAAAPVLITGLYGPNYRVAWPVTYLSLLVVLLAGINETPDRTFAAAGRMWLSTANNFVWTVLFVLIAPRLISSYLALGYAIANLIPFLIYVLVQLGWLPYLFKVRLRPFVPLAVMSVVAVVLAWLIAGHVEQFVQLVLAVMLGGLIMVVEWGVFLTTRERRALWQRITRSFKGGSSLC